MDTATRIDTPTHTLAQLRLDATARRAGDGATEECRGAFDAMLHRRIAGEPVQYIVGRQEFWSLDFIVTPDVLIPRPETELLVELAVASATASTPHVCDLGTGSGCIA